jgi:hypothetical protein
VQTRVVADVPSVKLSHSHSGGRGKRTFLPYPFRRSTRIDKAIIVYRGVRSAEDPGKRRENERENEEYECARANEKNKREMMNE